MTKSHDEKEEEGRCRMQGWRWQWRCFPARHAYFIVDGCRSVSKMDRHLSSPQPLPTHIPAQTFYRLRVHPPNQPPPPVAFAPTRPMDLSRSKGFAQANSLRPFFFFFFLLMMFAGEAAFVSRCLESYLAMVGGKIKV